MTDATAPKLIYLTLPETATPILNVVLGGGADGGGVLIPFAVTREQLLSLNAQIADALLKGQRK